MALCGGGGGSGAQQTATIHQSNSMPAWITEAAKANYATAEGLTDRPYQAYTGQRLADFTPGQQQAFTMTEGAMGAWQPELDAATATAQQWATTGMPQADIAAYMNPYQQQVIDASMAEMNRQGDIQRQQISRNMGANSAFGGARHGVAEGEQMRGQQEVMGNVAAGLNADSYNNALAQFNIDRSAQLGASNQLAQFAGAGQELGFNDINALLQTGAMQQGQDQGHLDLGYADFLGQRDYPIEMLNMLMSSLNAVPYTTSSMQTTSGLNNQQPNNTAQLLGGLGALAGGIGSFY